MQVHDDGTICEDEFCEIPIHHLVREGPEQAPRLEQGDVVQIHPDHRALGGALAIVSAVYEWGVQADVWMGQGKIAPVRLRHDEFARIGAAKWVRSI